MIESTRFGRYHLVERLGVGAMGSVYRARDESLGRDVAVKTLHKLGRSEFQLEMFQARFDNEARALAALSHPHVVNVFDVGVEDDTPYLVMELVEGRSLADRLAQEGPLHPGQACELGLQIAAALDAAHARGIVHRDVKPANILEAGPGQWKLADFGVAHVPDSSLTLTGQFLGSPAYAAPEALGEGGFGPPSDVYGLGATLYEALAGEPPFGPGGLLTPGALATDAPPRSIGERCPAAPPHVVQGIMGALARDPARRYDAGQLSAALQGRPPVQAAAAITYVGPPAPAAGGRRRIAVIAVAASILIFGIALGVGLSSDDDGARVPRPVAGGPPSLSAAPLAEERPERGPKSDKDRRHAEKEWKKVDQKLRQGKERDAMKHLRRILERDPDDEQALSLYRQLADRDYDD